VKRFLFCDSLGVYVNEELEQVATCAGFKNYERDKVNQLWSFVFCAKHGIFEIYDWEMSSLRFCIFKFNEHGTKNTRILGY